MAGNTLYSDLGTGTSVYDCCSGRVVSGSGSPVGVSYTEAAEFSPSSSGNVATIDAAVGYVSGTNAFYISLYTDNDGIPGTKFAEWDNLSSSVSFGTCCGLVTVAGITGVSLTAGTEYRMVIGPMSITDTTFEAWNFNSTGVMGNLDYSNDGGQTWQYPAPGYGTLTAFDLLSAGGTTPEPSSLLLFGTGLFGIFGVIRRRL